MYDPFRAAIQAKGSTHVRVVSRLRPFQTHAFFPDSTAAGQEEASDCVRTSVRATTNQLIMVHQKGRLRVRCWLGFGESGGGHCRLCPSCAIGGRAAD